ncbi:MAG: glycosyltransferase [Micromonosporaceae bacterium]|nr:glycosyltransferase [Micromonosporaceae bacterium]
MQRAPVSIILAAGGDPPLARTCLDALRATMGSRDELVCLIPQGRSDLRSTFRGGPRLTVLDEAPGDLAARWSAGLAATTHPIVVLLDGDVCVSAHWLDPVIAAFADPGVVAAGPRCHLSFGPQGIHANELPPDARQSIPQFRRFARQWRQTHQTETAEVDRLGPLCAAIRRSALERAGGPTADLPYEPLSHEGRILLVEGALVAHLDTPQCGLLLSTPAEAPLVSASLIVRDEEEVLPACLQSLTGFVDEIVVYDTGSVDGTRDLARDHGARVIEGYWNDHFADARNRALTHCRGSWILQIDADETLVVEDPARARAALRDTPASMLRISLEDIDEYEARRAAAGFYPGRMFRSSRGRFAGRLHEQPVNRLTGQLLPSADLAGVRIVHGGYTERRMGVRDKRTRNLRLAELAARDGHSAALAYEHLARANLGMDRFDEAIDMCNKALASNPIPFRRVVILKTLAFANLASARLAEANAALEQLRQAAPNPITALCVEAKIRLAERNPERAYAIVASLPASVRDDATELVGRDHLVNVEILGLAGLGRSAQAADLLRSQLRAGLLPVGLDQATAVLTAAGSGIGELAELFPGDRLNGLLYALNAAPAPVADDLLDRLWGRFPGKPVLLALGSRVARHLPPERAAVWSARLREHGHPEDCPLIAMASDRERPLTERVLAGALAVERFSDQQAWQPLSAALAEVPESEHETLLAELRRLAPGLAAAIEPATGGA